MAYLEAFKRSELLSLDPEERIAHQSLRFAGKILGLDCSLENLLKEFTPPHERRARRMVHCDQCALDISICQCRENYNKLKLSSKMVPGTITQNSTDLPSLDVEDIPVSHLTTSIGDIDQAPILESNLVDESGSNPECTKVINYTNSDTRTEMMADDLTELPSNIVPVTKEVYICPHGNLAKCLSCEMQESEHPTKPSILIIPSDESSEEDEGETLVYPDRRNAGSADKAGNDYLQTDPKNSYHNKYIEQTEGLEEHPPTGIDHKTVPQYISSLEELGTGAMSTAPDHSNINLLHAHNLIGINIMRHEINQMGASVKQCLDNITPHFSELLDMVTLLGEVLKDHNTKIDGLTNKLNELVATIKPLVSASTVREKGAEPGYKNTNTQPTERKKVAFTEQGLRSDSTELYKYLNHLIPVNHLALIKEEDCSSFLDALNGEREDFRAWLLFYNDKIGNVPDHQEQLKKGLRSQRYAETLKSIFMSVVATKREQTRAISSQISKRVNTTTSVSQKEDNRGGKDLPLTYNSRTPTIGQGSSSDPQIERLSATKLSLEGMRGQNTGSMSDSSEDYKGTSRNQAVKKFSILELE